MKPPDDPKGLTRIVGGKRYSTKNAILVADDAFFDGSNWERRGRNSFLYKTPHGAFFEVNLTRWQNERDTLLPISQEEAINLFEGSLTEHHISYSAAFPGVTVTDA